MADPIIVTDLSAWSPQDPLGLFGTQQAAAQPPATQPEPEARQSEPVAAQPEPDQQQSAPGIRPSEPPEVSAAASVDADMDGYAQRVKMQESSGRVNAKNPRSSATGLYQFTDDTWAAVSAKNPGLGLTPDGRFDADQQQRAMEALTRDNAGFLKRKGLPTDGGALYAAHFLGAPRAAQVLQADDATPIASIVGDDVMRRNPNLAGMSAGDFKAWTSRVGNGGDEAPRPPRNVPSEPAAPRDQTGKAEVGPVAPPEFFQIAGDLSERAPFARGKMESPQGLVIHHTGGRGTPEGIMEVFRQRGLATQYIMDREGQVFRALPDGTMGRHLRPSEINGLSNRNAIGIEIIARDDADVTPKQRFAARNFINYASSRYGFDKSQVFGHGELNSHKQSTEGMSSVGDWRQYKDIAGPDGSTAVAAAPPQSMRDRTLMAYAGGDAAPNPLRGARPGNAAPQPRGEAIVADADFKPVDPGGLWGNYTPPASPARDTVAGTAPAPDLAAPAPEIETALNADPRRKGPGQWRYVDDIDAWEKDWKDKNASTGLMGDAKRLLTMGAESIPQALSEVVRAIPKVGPAIVDGLDAVDRWMTGKGTQDIFEDNKAKAAAGLTPATKDAREKKWVDETKNPDGSTSYRLGAAWSDPRSYGAGLVESAPGTLVTMVPSMALARGAYVAALGRGASQTVAAGAAARTALIAGAVGEGILGGGQAASEVRERIGKLTPEVLKSSDAYQSLIREGKSHDQAIDALTNDAAAQAVVIAGVASAAFGGIGDRALAQILAEGVGGGLAKRIIRGAGRGAATGVLEEVPQEVSQQATQNLVIQRVDPNQRIAEGLPNAAAGGAVMGGIMGGGMGAAGGAASRRATDEPPAAPAAPGIGPSPSAPAPAGPVAPDKGPLAAAVQYGQERQAPPEAAATPTAPPAGPALPDGAPAIGSTVTIEGDEFGSFPGKIEGYEGGEALVSDLSTGELLQVPMSAVRGRVPASRIPLSGAPVDDVDPVVPEAQPRRTDAMGPAIPMSPQAIADLEAKKKEPGWRTIGGKPKPERDMTPVDMTGVPPASESTPATRSTSALPPAVETEPVGGRAGLGGIVPGGRVIVDAAGVDRFSAVIEAFDGAEALLRRDDGTSVQVPIADLRVSKLTKKQREAQAREENPPVPREQAQGPTIRRVNARPVEFPDDLHARLFDLGRLRRDSMRQTGGGKLDMDRVSPAEQAALAAAFKMGDQELGQLADDYRYRSEKFARDARSDLPTKMHTVNDKLRKRLEAEARRRAKQEFDAAPERQAAPASEPSARAVPTVEDAQTRVPGETVEVTDNRLARMMDTLIDRVEEAVEQVAGAPSVEVAAAEARAFLAAVPKAVRDLNGGEYWGQFEPLIAKIIKGGLARAPKNTPDVVAKTEIDRRANEAATSPANDRPEPSQAQKEAGNYKVGRIALGGLDISIENPAGSIRSGVDEGGKAWAVTMRQHYGYIRGTKGKDKDHIDVFVRPGLAKADDADLVFVVDQIVGGEFDEHKVMLGYGSRRAAENAYRGAYEKGWKGMGSVTKTTVGEFKQWLAEGNTARPFAIWQAGQQDAARADAAADPAPAPQAQPSPAPAPALRPEPRTADGEKLYPALVTAGLTWGEAKRVDLNPGSPTLAADARDVVLTRGRETGREYLIGIDDRGRVALNGAGDQANTKITVEALAMLDDPARNIVVHHNHPSGSSFSATDIAFLASPGIAAVYAHGNNGLSFRATLTPDARLLIAGMTPKDARKEIAQIAVYAQDRVFKPVNLLTKKGTVSVADAKAAHAHIAAMILLRAGVIDYSATAAPEATNRVLAALPADFIEKEARNVRVTYIEGRIEPGTAGDDRRSVAMGHPGDVGIVFEKSQERGADAAVADADPPGRVDDQPEAPQVAQTNRDADIKTFRADLLGTEIVSAPAARFPGGSAWRIKREGVGFIVLRMPSKRGSPPTYYRGQMQAMGRTPWSRSRAIDEAVELAIAEVDAAAAANAAQAGEIAASAAPVVAPAADPFAANKLFTADKVAAARARLKSKLSQINSGIDPEVLVDGMTIAGAYIEAGIRDFGEYASRMKSDFGDSIVPYLLSFWEGARNYPGLNTDGMTATEKSRELHTKLLGTADLTAVKPVIGENLAKPEKRKRKTGAASDMTLTQDWGVPHIDGYGNSYNRETGNETKDAFLKEARTYLNQVADLLSAIGYEPHVDRKGKPMKAVSVNEGGTAGSGEVSLTMVRPDGTGIYAQIGDTSLRNMVPHTASGIAIMYRTASKDDQFGTRGGLNRWAPVDLSAAEIAEVFAKEAAKGMPRPAAAVTLARPDDTLPLFTRSTNEPAELDSRSPGALEATPSGAVRGAESSGDAGRSPPGGGGADVSGTGSTRDRGDGSGNRVAGSEGAVSVPAGRDGQDERAADAVAGPAGAGARTEAGGAAGGIESDAGRTGRDRQAAQDREPAPADDVEPGSAAAPASGIPSTVLGSDYTLSDADDIGAGGPKAKYRANIAAIEIVRRTTAEKRGATASEQAALAKWVGWGGLSAAFERPDGSVAKGWDKEAAELKALLTPDEYAAARASTRNAHYTSPEVVKAMWSAVERLGFTRGAVLEPSVGAGNFIGFMPPAVRTGARVTAVELDAITGSIAALLYPTSSVKSPIGFQDLIVPDNHFDLAIGNPPFGSERLYDPKRKAISRFSIHNYFFAKSIDTLRPGGVLAMVITSRFLDGTDAKARQYIADRADLLGAIRLPNTAFLANAGTEVTTDIIFLRKRLPGEPAGDSSWVEVKTHRDAEGRDVPLNAYFVAKSEMMLGEFGAYGTMYGPDEPALRARPGDNLPALLTAAIETLPKDVAAKPGADVEIEAPSAAREAADVPVGSLYLAPDGSIMTRLEDRMGEARAEAAEFPNEKAKERVTGMIRIRDAFARLRAAQMSSDPNAEDVVARLRDRLNRVYDAFTKAHGPINADANKRLFRDDPTWPQVAALEDKFDKGVSRDVAKRTGETAREPSAVKAAIFSKRTQRPYAPVTQAGNAKDALTATLAEKGRLDLDAIELLYPRPREQIVEELGSLIYELPAGGFDTADRYLSGNVKQKLADARRAVGGNPRLQRNIDALLTAIPADIEAVDIEARIGSPWVPSGDVADFVNHIADARGGSATWSPHAGAWSVDPPQPSPSAITRWGTERARVGDLVTAALNGKPVTVYDRNPDGTSTVNAAATQAAAEKIEQIGQEWRNWLWQDDARRERLARIYNDTFNTDRTPTFDGQHLTLPGKVGDDIIELRPHQKDFVWRTLQSGAVLGDHTVGAGKTFSAIAAVMEMRRTGQARKPMIIVPNHLVGQWAADFIKLYPGAKILAATKRDFEKETRQKLFARVATGDWDAVIVAHSSFGKIDVHAEQRAAFIQEEIDDVTASVLALRGSTDNATKRTVKQMEATRANLATKMKTLLDSGGKDIGITFDELGVDALVVDEAHEFKNLGFSTSMTRVAGLGNSAGSQKASDMYMKSQLVLERTGGRNLIFLTGTPLSNTMAEMYTLQRYLDKKVLKSMGLAHFDAWAKVFGEVVTDWELSPSGSYKMNSRFARFINLPELMQRYQSFADVINNDDIKRQMAARGQVMPLPKVKGGKPRNIVVERSRDQAAFIGTPNDEGQYPRDSLVWRAENLPKKVEKGSDNMLKIMSDARKAALDMRLIDPEYGDPPGTKTSIAADEITRIWRSSSPVRGTQLVFIDLSTPKGAKGKERDRIRDMLKKAEAGDEDAQQQVDALTPDELMSLDGDFSVYDDLKQKLVSRGIPAGDIAFVHDANTEQQKEELFGKVRSGRIRILFGSTPRMGAGTNVQNRLVALHHLDAPWRPSDLEQRDGRGIRQGNELYAADPEGFEIEILRYATEKTLDARQWQTIESKAKFIGQMRKGTAGVRVVEDIGGEAANSAEMKAAASGNPLILEEMDLRQKLRKLEAARQQHDRAQFAIRDGMRRVRGDIDALSNRLPREQADAATVTEALKDEVPATINGAALTKPSELGAAVLAAARARMKGEPGTLSGKVLGLDVELDRRAGMDVAFDLALSGALDHNVFIADVQTADATGLGVRILNAAKFASNAPQLTQNRLRELERQLPQMNAQIAPWSGAADLEAARERHLKVIDELRPKKPPAAEPEGEAKASVGIGRTGSVELDAASMEDLAQLVSSIANQVVGDKAVNVEAASSIRRDRLSAGAMKASGAATDKVRIRGMFETGAPGGKGPIRSLISVSLANMSRFDIAETTYHETWHALDVLGLIPARDQMILERNTDQMRAALRKRLPRHNLAAMSPDEVRAYTFGFYAGDVTEGKLAGRGLAVMVRQVMARAVNMLRRIRNGLNGMGFRTAQDVFDAAIAGEFRAKSVPFIAMTPVGRASVAIDGDTPQKRDARFRQELRGRSTDMKPAMLALVPLNYFTELKRPNMGAVDDYLEAKRGMDAYRGKKHGEADEIAQQWLAYTRLGLTEGGKTKGRELADLMHEATLSGIDPSLEASDYVEGAPAGHAALRKRFMALSPKGRELFNTVRDAYLAQADELDSIILANVSKAMAIARKQAERAYFKERTRIERDPNLSKQERSEQLETARKDRALAATKGEWMAKARMTKLRIAFEQSRVPAPYFPLGRFGRYFVTAKDIDGTIISFSRFERSADRDRAAVSIREEVARTHPGATVEAGVLDNGSDVRQAMDPRIIAQIETLLGQAGVDDAVLDAIWQRYLQTMPDLSMRKRAIHRKGTAGYERDALRTFGSHMFHASHQMARVKFALDLQEHLNEAGEQARVSDDTTRGQMLVNELRLRHEWVMNPTGSRAAQFVTSAMFTWYLAASPAAALVNLSQTVMLGIPILGARLGGIGKASAAILRASKDFIGGGGDARKAKITDDERAALEAFYESGLVDRTQSHELAGVGDTGVQYSPTRAKVMSIIAWAFHKAEVMNREVTALAAYRLARGQGENHRTAVNTAHELTWKAHFDYANSSRARVMQGDTAKVLLVFQNYQLNMWYRLMRDTHQALKGESPAAKREARYQLAGVIGMMTMLAGVTGVAGYNVLMAVAGMFFNDEDDPRDFKAEMEGHVITLFGPDIGRMILKGVPGQLARIDLTSRLGMPDFFLRMPDGNSEGRNWYRDLIVAALGVTGSTIVNTGQGLHLISQGNLQRGAELLVPKAIADIMKSYRFANEGVLNVRGDPILERERLDAWDIISRATGFTSARIAEGYERNRNLREAEADVLKERRQLVNAWALSRLAGDDEGRSKALAAIQMWNQKPYAKGLRITQDTLAQSLQTRRLNARRRDDGVVIENKQLRRHLQGLQPERAY